MFLQSFPHSRSSSADGGLKLRKNKLVLDLDLRFSFVKANVFAQDVARSHTEYYYAIIYLDEGVCCNEHKGNFCLPF